MKIRIPIVVLLAMVSASGAALEETTPAPRTPTADPPPTSSPPPRRVPPRPAPPPAVEQPPAALAPSHDREALLAQSLQLLREQQRLLAQRSALPPKQPALELPSWLLPLALISAIGSLIAAALQPFLYWRARIALTASSRAITSVESKLASSAQTMFANIQSASTDVIGKIETTHEATISRLSSLFVELGEIKERLGKVAEVLEETATAPASGGDAVRAEHEVLAEHWKQFRVQKELGAGGDNGSENQWENLLNELPALVPVDLRPSLDAVLAPYREHRLLIQKIGIIPRVVNGEMPLASVGAELKRARDLTQLLISAQTADGGNRLQFPFQNWITDTFLPFADLYLQNYQKALLERSDADLQKGMSLVREILRIAAVQPIEVTLGETRFDSARHIGRFTSSDPHFADGVITGVVRNGFVENGREVIRQPEVVVNRVR